MLIRVERAGICGSDVQGVATRSPRRAPPLIMGHELVGEVVDAAAGGEGLVGRRVAVNPQVPCGVCLSCRSGLENVCQHRELVGGTPAGRLRRARRGAGALRPRRRRRARRRARGAGRAASPPASTPSGSARSRCRGRSSCSAPGRSGCSPRIVARLHGAGPDRRQRDERGAPRVGRAARGRGRRAGRARGRRGRAASTSSSTRSAPTRRGPRRSRCCGRAAARSGSACTTWRRRSRRSTSSCASRRSAASFAYTNADFARAVELLAEQPEAFRLPTRTCSLEEGARRVHGARRRHDGRVRQGVAGAGARERGAQ